MKIAGIILKRYEDSRYYPEKYRLKEIK